MTKYRAKPTTVDGVRFASIKESTRYLELKLLQQAGVISGLELQPVFKFSVEGRPVLIRSEGYPNGRQAKYVADFRYVDNRKGGLVWEVKGMLTPEYKLKRALFEALNPGVRILET